MKKFTRLAAVFMALCLSASAVALSGCDNGGGGNSGGGSKLNSDSKVDTSGVKEIYYLNFKPEISDKYDAIAKEYEKLGA